MLNKYDITLDTKTILLQSNARDILKKVKNRKGIDIKIYQVNDSSNKKDIQTVMTFLSSRNNPNPIYRRDKQDVDTLISKSLDKILLSDRVKSCNDFYRTNSSNNIMIVNNS